MPKFDAEDLLDVIETTFKANLNTKIAAIEAEKVAAGKGVEGGLTAIDTATGYYRQSFNEKMLQVPICIFYGIQNFNPIDVGGDVMAKEVKIFVEVIFVDNGQKNDTHRRVARYSRAIEETAKEQLKKFKGFSSQAKIEEVAPASFKMDVESSEEIKVGGILLTVAIV